MKAVGVFSVKGGVGKTLIAINIALRLRDKGKTGLLDADWDNSNFAQFTNFTEKIKVTKDNKLILPAWNNIKIFSPSLLFGRDKGVSMTEDRYVQMISDVMEYGDWGDLDYLVIDLPGGSSDIWRGILTIFSEVLLGDVIVTQPQMTDALEKGLQLHKFLDIPVLGVVNNMSYLTCPHGDKIYLFGSVDSTIEVVAKYGYEYLGEIPFITDLPRLITSGKSYIESSVLDIIVKKIIEAPVQKTSFTERFMEKITDAVKSEIEKILAYFIITAQRDFDFREIAIRDGFTEQNNIALTITNDTGTKVITRLVLKLKDGKLVVVSKPEKINFEIVASFRALARVIMGKAKRGDQIVDYDPLQAWLAGEIKAYGAGFTSRAIKTFNAIFNNQDVLNEVRGKYGKILARWI